MSNNKEYLTIRETSEFLSVSTQTVRAMIKRGELPAVKIGKLVRISKGAIDAMLSKGAVTVSEDELLADFFGTEE
jgi:excisionase family DNA binding protein